MDDIYQYRTNTDSGIRFRSCIWESPHIPISMVKWCVERFEPEIRCWLKLQKGCCSLEEALWIVPDRLDWWAEHFHEELGA